MVSGTAVRSRVRSIGDPEKVGEDLLVPVADAVVVQGAAEEVVLEVGQLERGEVSGREAVGEEAAQFLYDLNVSR